VFPSPSGGGWIGPHHLGPASLDPLDRRADDGASESISRIFTRTGAPGWDYLPLGIVPTLCWAISELWTRPFDTARISTSTEVTTLVAFALEAVTDV